MTAQKFLEKLRESKPQKIGKSPVVVIPLAVWKELEEKLEDFDMLRSKKLVREIARVRREKKLYSSFQAKEIFAV